MTAWGTLFAREYYVFEAAKEWRVADHMVKAKCLYLLAKIKQLRALHGAAF